MLDNDTVQHGTQGPFREWEHDHTSLVHVLWSAHHQGLDLHHDADEIAERIMRSRWLAAQHASVLSGKIPSPEVGER